MVTQHSFVGTAMLWQMFARRENGKERRLHSRHFFKNARRFRATLAISPRLESIGEKEVRLPPVILRKFSLIRRDVLKIREIAPMPHHFIQLASNRGPVSFQHSRPGKRGRVEISLLWHER